MKLNLLLAFLLLPIPASADCLQWICNKDHTLCTCVVEERPREKLLPDRYNPWPPELDDRYGNPRRRD